MGVKLERLSSLLYQQSISLSDVAYSLVLIRSIREESKNASNRSVLKTYCDWVLHSKINKPRFKILEMLHGTFKQYWSGDVNELALYVIEAFAFDTLRDELVQFCQDRNLPTFWFDTSQTWMIFREAVLNLVLESPIVFNGKNKREYKDKFGDPISHTIGWPKSFELLLGSDDNADPLAAGKICWRIDFELTKKETDRRRLSGILIERNKRGRDE